MTSGLPASALVVGLARQGEAAAAALRRRGVAVVAERPVGLDQLHPAPAERRRRGRPLAGESEDERALGEPGQRRWLMKSKKYW